MGWYLFLQAFGSNNFSVSLKGSVLAECGEFDKIAIVYTTDSLSASQINHLNRVTYRTSKKDIPFSVDEGLFECAEIEEDLVLLDSDGVWGTYPLDRDGVDVLLTELDILIIQKSYGKGVSR